MKTKTRSHCPILGQNCPDRKQTPASRNQRAAAFTLVEAVVATLIAAIAIPAFYGCVGAGFAMVGTTREDLRATQIILQRMEAIRLSGYDVLTNSTSYPTNVTDYYTPSGQTNGTAGTAYTVNYNWAPGPVTLPPSYRSNMVLVTVSASWKSGNVLQTRSNQTYVARYGIQRYVSGD
jgi:hypothetical protein